MVKLTSSEVLKLARLSKLRLSRAEVERLRDEIGAVLDYIEQLRAANVGNLPPTHQVTGLKNVTRPDEARDYGVTPAEWLSNAPAIEDGHIKVKRVL